MRLEKVHLGEKSKLPLIRTTLDKLAHHHGITEAIVTKPPHFPSKGCEVAFDFKVRNPVDPRVEHLYPLCSKL